MSLALIGEGVWSLVWAVSASSTLYAIGAGLALLALLGVVSARRWACNAVYLLALWPCAEWLLSIWFSLRIGYFSHLRTETLIATLAPGLGVTVLAAYCCFVAWRFVGKN